MKKRCLRTLFLMLVLMSVLSVSVFAAEDTSGNCGEDIIWSYHEELQLLSIFGSGSMYDYGEGLAPWSEWADEISEVQISQGIYTIGLNAFYGCDNLYLVNYLGTLEQWMSIEFRSGNEQLGLCAIECRDWKPDKSCRFGGFEGIVGTAFWLLDGQGNLTVYGTGVISRDSSCGPANGVNVPWQQWRDQIVTVTVKEGITTTSYELFADCVNLKRAYLPNSLQILDASTFSGCTALTEVEMPNYQGPFTLGSGAFLDCASLKSIELPPYTKEIDMITFQGCSALEEIVIPEGVETIGSFAFFNCSSLKTIYLPSTLNRLKQAVNINHYGESPFTGCSSLVNIVLPEGHKYAVDARGVLFDTENGWLVYAPDSLSGSYTIPDTVNYVWAGAFENCVNLTEIHISDTVDHIHNQAFRNCTSLKEVIIPDSVTEFGYDVFQDCTALEKVTISDQITILDGTFRGCTALRSVEIPNSVTELGYKTFSGCTALEEVEMSENITAIGNYSFENCTALTEISIPESVTTIGEGAFSGCAELISVDYAGFVGQWNEVTIAEGNDPLLAADIHFKPCEEHDIVIVEAAEPTCDKNGNTEGRSCSVCGEVFAELVELPAMGHQVKNGICTVCGEALDWYFNPETGTLTICAQGPMDDYDGELDGPWWDLREEIIHVVIEEGVTTVGNSAFAVTPHLKTVTLPRGITSIGRLAFQMCEELESINIPDTVKTIGEAAFNATTKLARVEIPKSVEVIEPHAFEGSLYREAYYVDPENPYFSSDLMGNLYNKEQTKLIMAPNFVKRVVLPATLQEIGDGIFALSSHMDAVYFCGTREQWDAVKIGERNTCIPAQVFFDVTTENYCDKGTCISISVEGKPATCTSDGYDDARLCVLCGRLAAKVKLEKLPHDYVDGVCTMCGAEKPVENVFTDVKTADWFYEPVLWAKEKNVTGGTSPTTFGPNDQCTRAQVVTFLWAANGKPEPASMDNPFTDVPNDAWYLKPVLWAVENGITGGISATEFGPDAYCTRAQVVTFLWAASGKPYVQEDGGFTDVAVTDWFVQPVCWAAKYNITGGVAEGLFGPERICTRAQVVTFLYKVYGNL